MPALIEVYDEFGECIGRCDSKCYNAKESGCICICGGINHGVGLERAIEETRGNAEALEEAHDHIDIPGKRPVQLDIVDFAEGKS
jgi:hypothetical protein